MNEKLPLSSPENEDWAVNDSVEQHLASLALSFIVGPKEEWNEAAAPLQTLKKWKRLSK